MSTITIRLPPDLKKRIARAAERAGTTVHGFILEAIAEKAEQEELRAEFQETLNKCHCEERRDEAIPWRTKSAGIPGIATPCRARNDK